MLLQGVSRPPPIYFTVNFFLVRTHPNRLMIQFMANTFQPITCLWRGWSNLPYPHTASKLISRDGPSARLLLASCHLHPAILHPAPAPKERQAQSLLNRSPSQQDSQERTATHNLTRLDNSQYKSLRPTTTEPSPGLCSWRIGLIF